MSHPFITFPIAIDEPFTSSDSLIEGVVDAVRERAALQAHSDDLWAVEVTAIWKYGQARARVEAQFRPDSATVEVRVHDLPRWDGPSTGTRNHMKRQITAQLGRLMSDVNGSVPVDISALIDRAAEVATRLSEVQAEAAEVLAQIKAALG